MEEIEGVCTHSFCPMQKASSSLLSIQLQVMSRDISHHHTDLTGQKKFLLRSVNNKRAMAL